MIKRQISFDQGQNDIFNIALDSQQAKKPMESDSFAASKILRRYKKWRKKRFSTYMIDFPFLVLDVVEELAGLSVPHILVLSDNSCQRPSYSARFRSIQKDLHMQEKVVWLQEYLNLLKLYHCRVINQKRVLP